LRADWLSCATFGYLGEGGISNEELEQQVNTKEEKAKKIEGKYWIGVLPCAFLKAKMFLLVIVFMLL